MKRHGQIYEAKNEPPVSTLFHIENLIIGLQHSIYYFSLFIDYIANQHTIVSSFKGPLTCKVAIISICDSSQVK
jgi:hypothetical protein